MEIKGNPTLRRPKAIEALDKFKKKNKYREYHENYGHTASEWHEFKKSLNELVDQG